MNPSSYNKQTDKTANNKKDNQQGAKAFLLKTIANDKDGEKEKKESKQIIQIIPHNSP